MLNNKDLISDLSWVWWRGFGNLRPYRRKLHLMINIYEIMQVADTPVFLLAGIGSLLISMTNRLGRIKDRTRVLQRAVLDHDEIQKSPIFLKAISKLT